jgi:hypothetical protein
MMMQYNHNIYLWCIHCDHAIRICIYNVPTTHVSHNTIKIIHNCDDFDDGVKHGAEFDTSEEEEEEAKRCKYGGILLIQCMNHQLTIGKKEGTRTIVQYFQCQN